MPNTSLNCPGPIQFTCVGPNTLIWRVRVNGTDYRGEYAFQDQLSHTFPRSIPLNPSLLGIEVLVVNASLSSGSQFLINIESTLTTTATLVDRATIQSAVGFDMNSTVYHFDIIGTKLLPTLTYDTAFMQNVE